MREARPPLRLVVSGCAAAFFLTLAAANWLIVRRLSHTGSIVENLSNPEALRERTLPGASEQDPRSAGLQLFRKELPPELAAGRNDLRQAVGVRKWARLQQTGGWDANDDSSDDPNALLARQRRGVPGACRRFAYVFAGALLAGGLDSRVVEIASGLNDEDPAHMLVEVWIPSLQRWVLMDSMFNTMFRVDGEPASAIDVHRMVAVDPSRVALDRGGATTEPVAQLDGAYLAMFRHIFVSRRSALFDAQRAWPRHRSFVHYASANVEPYPQQLKLWLLVVSFGSWCVAIGWLAVATRWFIRWRSDAAGPTEVTTGSAVPLS
jgi:hypothetical protein